MKNKDKLKVVVVILVFCLVFTFGFSVGVSTSYYYLVHEISKMSVTINLNETAMVREMNKTMDYQIKNLLPLLETINELECKQGKDKNEI